MQQLRMEALKARIVFANSISSLYSFFFSCGLIGQRCANCNRGQPTVNFIWRFYDSSFLFVWYLLYSYSCNARNIARCHFPLTALCSFLSLRPPE